MSNKYNNVFMSVKNSIAGTPLSGWLLILSVLGLIIGGNNFAEDTYSSFVGIQMMETHFKINPATWEFTYWAMSLFFQVFAIVFFFIYLADRKEHWQYLWFFIGFQLIDFIADTWYRSNGNFENPGGIIVSLILTFVFFTAGSEMALTLSFGLVGVLFKDGLIEIVKIINEVLQGLSGGAKLLAGGSEKDKNNDRKENHQNYPKQDQELQYQKISKPKNDSRNQPRQEREEPRYQQTPKNQNVPLGRQARQQQAERPIPKMGNMSPDFVMFESNENEEDSMARFSMKQ